MPDTSCLETDSAGCHRQLSVMREAAEKSPPEFIPTHDWQDILPNQAIPPVRWKKIVFVALCPRGSDTNLSARILQGLYIRVNLETGKKEAKLLD
ncbi:hypothetical protein BBJ28_00018073 [Nothophytophthora sp. Chile5]|nr:hypothetical protein BBJ28_00018073 [Nothophytophthora sp. Chile5]